MINVVYGNNVTRNSDIVNGKISAREFLLEHDVDLSFGVTTLNGTRLTPEQMDLPLSEITNSDKVYLLQVMKADNA